AVDVLVQIELAILHQAQGAGHRDVLTDRTGLEDSIRGDGRGLAGFDHAIAARPLQRAAVDNCYAEARCGVVGHALQDRDALGILAPERRIRRDAVLDPADASLYVRCARVVSHRYPITSISRSNCSALATVGKSTRWSQPASA